jgi:asparagine synthase (glutamine-hydrolysing)
MSMAVGVEVRVPLLDPDLVALAARIDPALKQKGRIGKWIFKKAMEPHLPHDVIYRPKVGFGVPLRHWLRHELRPLTEELLSASSLRNRGIFDPRQVDLLREADRQGRVDGTYTLFSIMCMELWCRLFVDGDQAAMVRRYPRDAVPAAQQS